MSLIYEYRSLERAYNKSQVSSYHRKMILYREWIP